MMFTHLANERKSEHTVTSAIITKIMDETVKFYNQRIMKINVNGQMLVMEGHLTLENGRR